MLPSDGAVDLHYNAGLPAGNGRLNNPHAGPAAVHAPAMRRPVRHGRPWRLTVIFVIVAAALAGVILFMAAGLIWVARLVHIGNLDAQALADKLATPDPVSALDWPELRLRAVVPQPGGPPLVLLHVGWPAHPRRVATLLLALDSGDCRSLPLLAEWCAGQASVAPVRREGGKLELRRRQSLERVCAVMVAEDYRPC